VKHLFSLVVGALLVASPALAEDAKPLVIKVGSVAPEGTPWSDWLDGVKSRLEKDSGNKVKLKLFLGGKLGGEKEMVELQALDISIGGLAAFVQLPESLLEIGTRFPGASLQLGVGSSFPVELELRNVNDVRLRNGTDTTRAGFMFVDLPESAQQQIQRYLMRVERERRSRESDLLR
jgi:hypothetical protein